MFKKLLIPLLMLCAAGPAFSRQGDTIEKNMKMWVVKSTFGSFKEEDEEALVKMALSGNSDGIMTLVQQGKSIVLDRGIRGLILYEDKINDLYQFLLDPDPKTPGKEIRVWAPRDFLWEAGTFEDPIALPSEEEVANVNIVPHVPFDIASLPRVPIHFPGRRLTVSESINLSNTIEGQPFLHAWCWCNRVDPKVVQAISEMMHLPPDRAMIAPYAVYGPIPDAHNASDTHTKYNTWLVEIQFSLEGDKKIYTAVVHGGGGPGVVSCELGEDTPTLKADSTPPAQIQSAPAPASALTWLPGMTEAYSQAAQQDKNILIYFTGLSWSPYCVEIEKEVLTRPEFQQYASQNLILVKFDFPRAWYKESGEGADLRARYGVSDFPTLILVNPAGVEISRCKGYLPETQFLAWLKGNPDKETATPEAAVPVNPDGEQVPALQGAAPDNTPSGSHDFLLSVITAMANYDWQTLTNHMVDGQINYFGHRHARLSYIIGDIQNDSRQFGRQDMTYYWDSFKHEVSQDMLYDSVNVYAVIQEFGRLPHHAMERITVGYTWINGTVTIYSLTLKVLHS